jgi:hypothetical protein
MIGINHRMRAASIGFVMLYRIFSPSSAQSEALRRPGSPVAKLIIDHSARASGALEPPRLGVYFDREVQHLDV